MAGIFSVKESAQNCWKSIADSKAKSTHWLLINHALPVESRIKRGSETTCKNCGEGPVDLEHVFGTCERAKIVWKDTSKFLAEKLGIKRNIGLNKALIPGDKKNPVERILTGINAIVVRNIWLDYCNTYFGSKGETVAVPPEVLVTAISSDIITTVHAERGLLDNDLKWWKRKLVFHEELIHLSPDVEGNLASLKTRIKSYKLLLKGEISEEFQDLAVIYDLEV